MGNCVHRRSPVEKQSERRSLMKVKVVLTRGELEWLQLQLKGKGEKRLEDVMEEINRRRERRRKGKLAWRPSLESITETY